MLFSGIIFVVDFFKLPRKSGFCDTFLFSVVQDITLSARNLNNDLKNTNKWVFQWKMTFNPDPIKQAQNVTFQGNFYKPNHSSLDLSNNSQSISNS